MRKTTFAPARLEPFAKINRVKVRCTDTMKKHNPIKRHSAIVSFSKDHHFGLLLVWKIRQGLKSSADPERISNYVLYFFEEDLDKHFRDEEDLLFSKLPASDALRRQAEAEHRSILQLIEGIKENKQSKDLLMKIADELERHIRFEERELFNHLQRNLSEEELETILSRIPGHGQQVDDQWKDNFWEKKQ